MAMNPNTNSGLLDRPAWLVEKRRLCEVRMDTLWAPDYDTNWGHINPTHARFIERFLLACPPTSPLLDAACGTGKYWPSLRSDGRLVVGIDQSSGMLAQAGTKYPEMPAAKLGLQDLPWHGVFAGVVCVDAMENIAPEDWPPVLANFARVLVPGGLLYFTVEVEETETLAHAYEAAMAMGLPVVPGEVAHEGGYHYYPDLDTVRNWLADAGFTLVEEEAGDGYHHLLAHRAADEPGPH